MRFRHRFSLADDCLSCTLKSAPDFCNLPRNALALFNSAGYPSVFPPGAVLLVEGQAPRGVFVLCSGRAKLSMSGQDGKTVIVKIAGGRRVLGLSAVVSRRPCPFTATTLEPCQVKFIAEKSLLKLLESDAEAALSSAAALSREVGRAFQDVYELLLARSSTEKLARLLLSWVPHETGSQDLRLEADLTHEEIAQMIGSSRETVTRLFADMKRKQLIRQEGSTLVISNRNALQALAA